MRATIFVLVFLALSLELANAGGRPELVNEQEIALDQIYVITIRYRSDDIILLRHDSDTLVIREYMSANNSDLFAVITRSGNELLVTGGHRPVTFGAFGTRIEISIPASNRSIAVSSSSGDIVASGEHAASSFHIETSSGRIVANSLAAGSVRMGSASGRITANSVTADVVSIESSSGRIAVGSITANRANVESSSGGIALGAVNGDVSVRSASGNIELDMATGAVDIRSSSGRVRGTLAGDPGDVSVETASGGVTLNLPYGLAFNFSSRTSSGNLHTPFDDRLFRPLTDRSSAQGVIGGGGVLPDDIHRNIDIRTGSGSIRVNWVN
ncbi:MAG: DUF4097 domain-containing protein [Treponema sp.]|nr:DUF4097 domain-containing protein [Treponema sp.]